MNERARTRGENGRGGVAAGVSMNERGAGHSSASGRERPQQPHASRKSPIISKQPSPFERLVGEGVRVRPQELQRE